MAANNVWFNKLKARAISVQETAKTKLEKISETVDKKLKEAQEDLEKQRSKADAPKPVGAHLQRWRPSAENPDGELIAEAKPPPPPPTPTTATPVVELTVPTTPSTPSTPETSQPSSQSEEPITIVHRAKRRAAKKTLSSSVSAEQESDLNNQKTDQAVLNKTSNDFQEKTSTVDEADESPTTTVTSQKEELSPVQISDDPVKNKINKEKEEVVPTKTELYQENIQTNISTDNLTAVTSVDKPAIEQANSNDIPSKVVPEELPVAKNVDDVPTEDTKPEKDVVITLNNEVELTNSTKTDDLSIVTPETENISMKIPEEQVPVLSTGETSPIESTHLENTPIDEPKDELLTTTNIDNTTDANPQPQEESLVHVQDDQSTTTVDVDDSSAMNAEQEDILINKANDENELSTSTNINDSLTIDTNLDNVSMEIPDDQSAPLTNNENSTTEDTELENIEPTKTFVDESSTIPVADELPVVEPTADNMEMKTVDDQLPESSKMEELLSALPDLEDTSINRSVDEESLTLTQAEEIPVEEFNSDNIPIDSPMDEEPTTTTNATDILSTSPIQDTLPVNTPVDELPTLTNIDNLPDIDIIPENIPDETPDVESTYSNIENSSSNLPKDALLTITNIDNALDKNIGMQNILTQIPDDELPLPTNIDEPSTDNFKSEAIPFNKSNDEYELQTLTNIDNLPTVDSSLDDTPTKIPEDKLSSPTNIEDSTVKHSDAENILTSMTDDTSNAHIDMETISAPGSVNVSWPATDPENSPSISVGSENYSIPTTGDEDELATAPKTNDLSIVSSKLDDELSTSTDIDDTTAKHIAVENDSEKTIVDEVPKLPATKDLPNVDSNLNDELSLSTNVDDSNTKQIHLDNSSTKTTAIEVPPVSDTDDLAIVNSNVDNKLSTSTNIDDVITKETGRQNNSKKSTTEEAPTLPNTDNLPIVDSTSKNNKISTSSTTKKSKRKKIIKTIFDDDESPTLSDIDDTPIEKSKPKVELPTSANIVHSPSQRPVSNKNHSTISEKKKITLPNELEDSFGEIKVPTIPVQQPPPKEPSQNTAQLAALRAFISTIEDEKDEKDENDDFRLPKKDTIIVEKTVTIETAVNTTPEQQAVKTSDVIQRTLSAPSTSSDDDDDFSQAMVTDTLGQSNSLADEQSYDERTESIWTMSFEAKPVQNKRYPLVNSHPIPAGTKIVHMNCSSTYIYLCTTERKLFYAKLNPNEIEYPFKWQQHNDLAEQIVVSVTNRTVWRLYNKHVYTANDPIKYPPLGSKWNEIKINQGQALLSISINDQCGWFIKDDGTLWLIRNNDKKLKPLNVACPFNLNTVFCFSEKVGVSTRDGDILIRVGCSNDCPEGDGWIFIDHNFGPIDDFQLLTNNNIILIIDKKHHLWIHECSSDKGFYEILFNDEYMMSHGRYLMSVNAELLCLTDCEEQIQIFSDCLTGYQWKVIEKNTRLQRLIGAFSNEDFVWALTTERLIAASNGRVLDKPRQAQCLTHASFVPNNSSLNTVLWSLDESCSIYVRPNLEDNTEWEQANQMQFEWSRRLVNIACNYAGVWAVDDQGYVHFRHKHISASQTVRPDGQTLLPPAWITVPGEAKKYRSFAQVFCGPTYWMIYATDNKQNVYTREGISKESRVGTSWKLMEDCSALELAISSDTLWVLTSHGQIECRENLSVTNPIGTRLTTLPGLFLSLTVSMDDTQVWALDSKRNLLKLDRLTALFEK